MAVDRHVRRSGADYAQATLALLPKGQAWPREPASTLVRTITGLAKYWGFVDGRAADLLERETDPRYAIEMFPDWERAWGLPSECFFSDGGNMEGRRRILMLKMTLLGGQSREFFYWVADQLGISITIREHSPFMVGVSRCGYTWDENGEQKWRIGPPENRFYWSILPSEIALQWFRVTQSQTGVDPHLRMGYPEQFVCLIEQWKPAHTVIIADYSGSDAPTNPMAGTP